MVGSDKSRETARLVTEAAENTDVAVPQLCKAREWPACVARGFGRAEEEVNHSLQELKTSMEATVAQLLPEVVAQTTGLTVREIVSSQPMTEVSEDEIYEVVTVEKCDEVLAGRAASSDFCGGGCGRDRDDGRCSGEDGLE